MTEALLHILAPHLAKALYIKEALVYETLPSTNDEALRLEKSGFRGPALVIALEQTCGRGRLQRPWLMKRGQLACSLLLRAEELPRCHLSWLSIISALAVREALAQLNIDCGLKWPNDLVYEDPLGDSKPDYFLNYRKVGGLLIEGVFREQEPSAMVIGIGLNIEEDEALRKEVSHAGFLSDLRGDVGLLEVVPALLDALDRAVSFMANLDLAAIKKAYEQSCVTLNKKVRVLQKGQALEGLATGINDDGALLIFDGVSEHVLYAGDVLAARSH